jgi:hypothetical protein
MKFQTIFVCAQVLTGSLLIAQPGSGIRLGEGTVLVPQVNVSYSYDDNVNLRRRAVDDTSDPINVNTSDTSTNVRASLNLTRFAGNRNFRSNVWFGESYYDSFDELNGQNYGINVGYFWGRPTGNTTFDISAGYEYAVDRAGDYDNRNLGTNTQLTNFETVSERVERNITSTEARLTHRILQDVGSTLLFGYYDTDYDSDVYNDRTNYDYTAELNYDYSIKTQPYLRVGLGIDEDAGFVEDGEKPFFLVGVRYRPTEKTRIELGVGWEEYTRTPWLIDYGRDENGAIIETGRSPGEESSNDSLKYTASVFYEATQKTTFSLRAGNGYDSVSAGFGRSRKENSVSATLRHQTTPRINQSILVNWRKDEYFTDSAQDDEDEFIEVKDTMRYEYRVDYSTARPWLNLFGSVNYEDGESRFESENYTQLMLTLGAKLSY